MLCRRLAPLLVVVALLSFAPMPLAAEGAPSAATTLLVNDAATAANAFDLVATNLSVPPSLGMQPHVLSAPPGISVSVVAAGLKQPRFMAFDAAGNLLLADDAVNAVYRYPASNGSIDPTLTPPSPLLQDLDAPSNVALWGGYLYVGETTAISRYSYDPVSGSVGPRQVVVSDLPGGGHATRTIAFGPDGSMYVSVGSSCNICNESDPRRAAILRYAPDGSGYERFAYGLRNAVGLAIQPSTGLLWATVNERDDQGNEIPPDLVTIVSKSKNYGWPACQPPSATPQTFGAKCSGVTPPTIGIQAHSAPLGLAFYTGQAFPADYTGDLFVAQHGSWNRQPPAAPKLLRIHFEGDQPVWAKDFLTGWQDDQFNRWGRPAGVTVAPDGSLIVSDDAAGILYRVSVPSA
jgi:glucose/arabinose dehydrogenase